MDTKNGQKLSSKAARKIHKFGDRAVGTIKDADRLNECAFLANVRHMTVDIEDVDAYLKTPLSSERPSVTFRVLADSYDVGDQQQPSKTRLLRGQLNWANGGKVEFFKENDIEEKGRVLFSVGFPKNVEPVGEGTTKKIPLAKIKSQGVQVFRMYEILNEAERANLEVTKVSSETESKMPYFKISKKTTILSRAATFAGFVFEKTKYQCLYMGTQKVATISPIMSLVQNQIGYTVRFASAVPYPEHQVKCVALSVATLLLLKVGPVDVKHFCEPSV